LNFLTQKILHARVREKCEGQHLNWFGCTALWFSFTKSTEAPAHDSRL